MRDCHGLLEGQSNIHQRKEQVEAPIFGRIRLDVTSICLSHVLGQSRKIIWLSLRYQRVPDRNVELRERILKLAHRYRRYGAGMIYLKLRQAGLHVNHKRVDRLYALEKLQIKRRRRKKVPVGDRQPLLRPETANEVWSMDFVFDRVAGGRAIKSLVIVDDATHEAVAIVPQHHISGQQVVRILERIGAYRGLPKIIRTDNGKEFCGRAMLMWAHQKNVALRLIERKRPVLTPYLRIEQW